MGLGFTFKATDEASPVMRGVQNNLTKTGEAAKSAQLSTKDFAGGMQRVAAVSAVAGAAIVGGLGIAAHQATEFGRSISEVASITDRATFPLSVIEALGKDMARTYGGDVNQQVKALYQAVSSGASNAAEATSLLHTANKLAIGGLSDSTKAIDALTNVLNAYGMAMTDAEKVSDAMFVTVKVGKTTVDELASVIGRVAPLAQAAGVRMDEMFASITAASTKLGNATESVTGLKAVIAGIMKPTSDAAAEAARLGIKFDSTTLRSKGLVAFLESITKSSKFTATTFEKLFGSVEAINVVSALTANNGQALASALDAMGKKAGATGDAFATVAADAKFAGDLLKANFQIVLIEIGQAIMPAVSAVTRFVTMAVQAFQKLPEPLKRGIVMFTAVAGVVAVVAGVIGGLVAALLTSEIPLMAVAAGAGALVQMMIPLVVVGGAVAATAYAMKLAWESNTGYIRTTLIPAFEKVKLAWDAVSQAFSQGGFSGKVRDELNKAENAGIKQFAINLFSWFSRIQNFVSNVGKGFSSAIDGMAPTFARLSLAVEKVGGAFMRLFGGKQDPTAAAQSFDRMGEAGKGLGATLARMAEVIVNGITYVLEFAASFGNTIAAWTPTFSRVWDSVKALWSAFGELGSALGQLAAAFGIGGTGAETAGQRLAGFVVFVAEAIGMVAKFASYIVSSWAGAFQIIGAIVGAIGELVKFWIQSMISGFVELGKVAGKVFDAIGSVFGKKNASGAVADSLGLGGITKGGLAGTSNTPQATGSGLLAPLVNPATLQVPSATPTASSSPATADVKGAASSGGKTASASEIGNAVGNAMRAQPPPPVQVNAPILLDGEKIGEAIASKSGTANARSFTPGPAPSG